LIFFHSFILFCYARNTKSVASTSSGEPVKVAM
jgi:hypothetical protein